MSENIIIARDLLESLIDDELCQYDHHGGCQVHNYLSLESGEDCPQSEAKKILKETQAFAVDDLTPEQLIKKLQRFGFEIDSEWTSSDYVVMRFEVDIPLQLDNKEGKKILFLRKF